MKKEIKVTFIDTAGHGYYSVSKNILININFDITKISGFSGMDFTKVYLEEDCDAALLFDFCKTNNIEIIVKRTYNEKFCITHNFNSELFNITGKIGDTFKCFDDNVYSIVETNPLIIKSEFGKKYKLPKTNPFKYIKDSISFVEKN